MRWRLRAPLSQPASHAACVRSPPAGNMSRWTWGDYRWFVTGEAARRCPAHIHLLVLTCGRSLRCRTADRLGSFSASLPDEALQLYPSSAHCPTQDRCPERSFTTMASDIRVTCPNNELARRAAGKRPPRHLSRVTSAAG